MKKFIKILFILSLCLCLAGALVLGASVFAGGIDEAKQVSGMQLNRYDQEKTRLDDFNAVEADLSICDLDIRVSGDDHAYLEYHVDSSLANTTPIEAEVSSEGVLSLHDKVSTSNKDRNVAYILSLLDGFSDDNTNVECQVILYLPQKTLSALALDLAVGNLDIDGISADNVSLTLSYGDITLTNCSLSSCDFDLALGNLYASALSLGDVNTIDLSYGDITLELIKPESLSITADTDYGEIALGANYNGSLTKGKDESSCLYTQVSTDSSTKLAIYADSGSITLK